MKRIGNINEISDEFIWKDRIGLITKELGTSTGSQKLYVNMDSVPPKGYSTKYHSHSQQEEFFYIISGNGILRLNNKETAVSQGDFLSKPAGENIAHTFYNSGEEPLVILDIGTKEKEDTCYYPDEDIYLHKSNGKNNAFRGTSFLKEWVSDPNE
ncbi:cupin domain-containing protein [Anaerocolumna sp. AGMB13025]|uniref:cupin domain-containing protein n=1 Tax=Anaerocolumna sp. AGMB13025 TaxID=3039116 RepID=UPI00241EB6F0|nr:cupin domain-containing protein [Anaerocolumna sp. AGMB13025]WFR56943.1 cupin domain-containing protein [Anaerocolumna sp. AGMB13025]